MRVRLPAAVLALGAAVASGPPGCHDGKSLLRAKIIEMRDELVGGPVAMADVGDFLLENDRVRVAILGAHDSPGPGVFGGSLVDIDRRRTRVGFEGGLGRDRFAETFALANLLVPDPTTIDVKVLKDGSDGKEAAIRVEGAGEFLFEALSILRTQQPLLEFFFPDVRTVMRFETDYILRPGNSHVLIRTTLRLGDDNKLGCPSVGSCSLSCPNGLAQGPDACLICECSDVLPLEIATEPTSVFGTILGDPPDDPMIPAVNRAGIVAGDFVFFGNQNDVFAPGPGFDEDAAVQDAYVTGRNTFQQPLSYDFVAAAGGDVSYGYFTVRGGDTPPAVNVPLFASAATAFLAASKTCAWDAADDAACDRNRAFSYERYLVVGDGDVASITEEMYRVRGTKTSVLEGQIVWAQTMAAAANARVFVFADPDPGRSWGSVDQLVAANVAGRGDSGLLNVVDADVGLDLVEDGAFHTSLPLGRYVLVAQDDDGAVVSEPQSIEIAEAEGTVAVLPLPAPAKVSVRVTDEAGQLSPAKIALVSLDASGAPLAGDGLRRTYLGNGRLGNGRKQIVLTTSGETTTEVEAGRYRVVVSRGPERSIHVEDIELSSGHLRKIDAVVGREIDTTGWMSADIHLHSQPSFDSGMPLDRRVATVLAEEVELGVSTDHDVESDYRPVIRDLRVETQLAHAVGAEITTLEQGHFIGFPLAFDALIHPTHGAHDWTCESGGQILDAIRAAGDGMKPFTIVAHPRDGFFGYFDQLGVDGFTLNRETPMLEASNPVFETASCDFDGMELIQSKRFDLVRTPTVSEVIDFNRCMRRLSAAADPEALDACCPEVATPLAPPCKSGEPFPACKTRHRTALAWAITKRMLVRTEEEQDENWTFAGTQPDSEALCPPALVAVDDPVPAADVDQPCTYRPGHVDDYFRLLEHGMVRTQIASSDSHAPNREPGYPRTYFRSPTDQPGLLPIGDAVDSLRAGRAFDTYGPFVRAVLSGKTYGDVVSASPGANLALELEVDTASWFGVDRVEVYLNGRIVRVVEPEVPASELHDVRGKISFTVPDRDSWVVVVAMGLRDDLLMAPVSLDVPFGEVQLSQVASNAFALIPLISDLFVADPIVPDWSPVVPYAFTNPIFIDTGGDGKYDAPLGPPDFCSKPCDPAGSDDQCPPTQQCLDEHGVCGKSIIGSCDHRRPALGKGH